MIPERVLLIGVQIPPTPEYMVQASLAELKELVQTAGGYVVNQLTQSRPSIDPAYCIGTGLLSDVAKQVTERGIDTVVFDLELSETQARNLEQNLECKVLDRTQIILDIFAQKARTREGKLQVELAQLKYLLPRLIGRGQELSRLAGGIGTRGPGETKLESDRRRIRRRISILEREIDQIAAQRQLHRLERKRRQVPICAIVGYTNAGKSSLLNLLSGIENVGIDQFLSADKHTQRSMATGFSNMEVAAENKLFATLDPTVRQITLPGNLPLNIVDTVGFIQRIPHSLVAAFRATLEEITKSDLIIHLIDGAHPMHEQQLQTGSEVLRMLEAERTPTILVYNKIDQCLDDYPFWPENAIGISAKTAENIEQLYQLLVEQLRQSRAQFSFFVPYEEGQVIHALHELGEITNQDYLEQGVKVIANLPHAVAGRFREYLCTNGEEQL
ncbi:MAG: GTPase HflX [Limnochordia bacterium]|nr:GTPase HflX [Limnochordia bacterium]